MVYLYDKKIVSKNQVILMSMQSASFYQRRARKKARIEIIPMIDVIFFLLVFFMISSLALTRLNSLPVALPKTSQEATAMEQKFILTVEKTGALYVNRTPVTLENLGTQLAYAMHDSPQESLVVNADKAVPYGMVLRAMDAARKIGVRKFALAMEHRKNAE